MFDNCKYKVKAITGFENMSVITVSKQKLFKLILSKVHEDTKIRFPLWQENYKIEFLCRQKAIQQKTMCCYIFPRNNNIDNLGAKCKLQFVAKKIKKNTACKRSLKRFC